MEEDYEKKDSQVAASVVEKTALPTDVSSSLDGGWAWIVCCGAFVVHFLTVGQQNSAGVVYSALIDGYSAPRGKTAWVTSVASSMMYLFAAVATALSEHFGSRLVVCVGSFIAAAGLLASSFSPTIEPLFATYGVVWGLGSSFGLFPTLMILTKYFKKRLSLAAGTALAGASLGTLVYGPSIEWLSSNFGISVTFQVISALQSLMFLSALTYRPVPFTSPQQQNRRKIDFSVFRNKRYIVWTISLCTFMLVFLVPFVHLVRFAEDKGVSGNRASLLSGFMAVGAALGSLLFGYLCDLPQFNRLKVCPLAILFMGISAFLMTITAKYELISIFAFVFGVCDGAYEMLVPVVTRDLVGVNKVGAAIGILYCLMAFPKTLGPPVAGMIFDATHRGDVGFFVTAGVATLAAAVMYTINWIKPIQTNEEKLLSPSCESERSLINKGARKGLAYT